MFFGKMSALSATGHRTLAASIVAAYAVIAATSVYRHSERARCQHLTLRAVSLLREAARSSLRADKKGSCAEDRYADATNARVYVRAVERLLSAQEVKNATGLSLDELRAHTDIQWDTARQALEQKQPYYSNGSRTTATPSFTVPQH